MIFVSAAFLEALENPDRRQKLEEFYSDPLN